MARHRFAIVFAVAVLAASAPRAFAAEAANIVAREGSTGMYVGSQMSNWSGGAFFFPGIGLWATTAWNAYHARLGERPEKGWLIGGYLFGGMGLAMGVGLIHEAGDSMAAKVAGAFTIAHAVADLVFTAWAHTKPAPRTEGLSVRPIGGTDLAGGGFAGVGLRYTH